jgi:hypothetical protein
MLSAMSTGASGVTGKALLRQRVGCRSCREDAAKNSHHRESAIGDVDLASAAVSRGNVSDTFAVAAR